MWKVQLAQGLWNFRQSTWLYFPPAAQAPSCVQRVLLLLASPTAALQLCGICRAHTLVSPVPLHLRLHGTSLKPLPSTIRAEHHQAAALLEQVQSRQRKVHPEGWGLPAFPHHSPTPRKPLLRTGVLGQHANISWRIPSTRNTALCFLPDLSQGGGLGTHQQIQNDKPLQAVFKLRAVSPWVFETTPTAHPPQLPLPSLQPAGSRPGPRSPPLPLKLGRPGGRGRSPQRWGQGALTPAPARPNHRLLGDR